MPPKNDFPIVDFGDDKTRLPRHNKLRNAWSRGSVPVKGEFMTGHMSRRTLPRQTAAVAGAAAFPIPSLLADRSPNARLAVAVIGCGGRGEASLMTAAEEKLVAIADVDDARLAAAAAKVSGLGVSPKPFFDYRRMFDAVHKDIDAVFIATPDHHHAPALMMAMQLGKHVHSCFENCRHCLSVASRVSGPGWNRIRYFSRMLFLAGRV